MAESINCTLNGWRCRVQKNWYASGNPIGTSVTDSNNWKTDFTSNFGSISPIISSTHYGTSNSITGNMYTVCIKFTTPEVDNISKISIKFKVYNYQRIDPTSNTANKLFGCLRTTSASNSNDDSASWTNTIGEEWSTDKIGSTYTSTNPYTAEAIFKGNFQAGTPYYLFLYTKNNGTSNLAIYGMNDIQGSRVISAIATYENPTYTITYNANGGTSAPGSQTKKHNENLTLSSVKPTKQGSANEVTESFVIIGDANGGYFGNTGAVTTTTFTATKIRKDTTTYSFSKWNTKADGSGKDYEAGKVYTDNANLTLYAQYTETVKETIEYENNDISNLQIPSRNNQTIATYTVKFDGNGPLLLLSSKKANTIRKYSFGGWATSQDSTNADAESSYTSETTLYAYWQYTEINGTVQLHEDPTYEGYYFLGWGTEPTQTENLKAGGEVVEVKSDITYYAIWGKEEPIITIGGSYIYVDGVYKKAQVYLYDNNSWKLVQPYLHDGTLWRKSQ